MCADATGSVHLVTGVALTVPPYNSQVYYLSRSPGGTWSSSEDVSSSSGYAGNPTIACDNDGSLHVLWDDSAPSGSSRYQILYSEKLPGGPWSAPVNISNNAGNNFIPTISLGPDGILHAIWDDESAARDVLYASRTGAVVIEGIDPNPALLIAGDVSTLTDLLGSNYGSGVLGLAADGITRVLLRATVPGSGWVEFRLSDENGIASSVGTLRSPGGTEDVMTLLVPVEHLVDGRYMAFAVLKAPSDFVRGPADGTLASRPIEVSAVYAPAGGGDNLTSTRRLDLYRPPVLLLHGIWDSAQTWGWSLLNDSRFLVHVANYKGSNAAPFTFNVNQAQLGISQAVKAMRRRSIAVTQADAFGHSMGGLLLRMYAAGPSYQRDNDFRGGDIHKLVTVDTPHLGSTWANLLYPFFSNPVFGPFFESKAIDTGHCFTCGAVADLREDGAAICALSAVHVPVHAFVGVGGSDMISAGLEASFPTAVSGFLDVLRFFGVYPDVFPPPGLQHDLVVGRISQEGGLTTGSSQTSSFGFASLSPPNLGLHIFSVTRETQVGDRAVEILNAPVGDSQIFASGFPKVTCSGESVSRFLPSSSAVGGGSIGGLEITEPLAGTSISPGQPLRVSVQGTGSFEPARVLVSATHDTEVLTLAPFSAMMNIPADVTGDVVIAAFAFDAAGNFAAASEVIVHSESPASLVGITANPQVLYMFSFESSQNLSVVGHYDDGVDRDISASSKGTIYASSDSSIAEIDGSGLVARHGVGVVTITATNGTHETSALVVVVSVPLQLEIDNGVAAWPPMAGAVAYDVVRGDLALLRSTGGDYTQATSACLADDLGSTSLSLSEIPELGNVFWYLVRAVNPGGPQSYDESDYGITSQVGSRDPGINGSTAGCH